MMSGSVVGRLRAPLRRLVEKYPVLRGPAGRTWNTYERFRFRYHAQRNAQEYQTEAAHIDPYQLIRLPPEQIGGHSPGRFDSISDAGRVIGGDWDKPGVKAFEDRFRYPSFQDHFINGVPWSDTEFYQTKIEKIKSDREGKYISVEALNRKCMELDRMYREIRDGEYKTQAEIKTEQGTAGTIIGDGGRGFLPGSKHLVRNEVAVDIARNGEPMLNEGRHRTCIVKILELDHIPVRVVVRHREWQNLRNEIATYLQSQQFDSFRSARHFVETRLPAVSDVIMGIDHPDLLTVIDEYCQRSSKHTYY